MVLGWSDIAENESVSISKELAIVLNNIYLVILSSQMLCTISPHQKLIFTAMQMQDMHVAVDLNYHLRHNCTI